MSAPKTAIDVELLKQTLQEATYGGIPFGVETYQITTGRDLAVHVLGVDKTTVVGGGSGLINKAANRFDQVEFTRQKEAFAAKKEQDKLKDVPTDSPTKAQSKVDGSSTPQTPDQNMPELNDNGAVAHVITLRCFFMDVAGTRNNLPPSLINEVARNTGAFLSRESYTVNRDKFLELVNSGVPHQLQLPSYGAIPCIAGTVKTTWSNQSGGIEYIDVEFYRDTKDLKPVSVTGTQLVIGFSKDYLFVNAREVTAAQQAALDANRNSNFNIPWGLSEHYQDLNGVALAVASAEASITTTSFIDDVSASIAGVTGSIDKYIRQVTEISNDISSLILAPARLAEKLLNSYNTLLNAVTGPVDAYNYMKNRFTVLGNKYDNITDAALETLGLKDDGYSLSVDQIHLNTQFNFMCTSVVDITYFSSEEVIDIIEDIKSYYNLLLRINSSFASYEDSFALLQSIYGATLDYLVEQQALLPNVRTITTRENTPLLVTAHSIYGTTLFEELLARRNNVNSALYPPTELEVLVQ